MYNCQKAVKIVLTKVHCVNLKNKIDKKNQSIAIYFYTNVVTFVQDVT